MKLEFKIVSDFNKSDNRRIGIAQSPLILFSRSQKTQSPQIGKSDTWFSFEISSKPQIAAIRWIYRRTSFLGLVPRRKNPNRKIGSFIFLRIAPQIASDHLPGPRATEIGKSEISRLVLLWNKFSSHSRFCDFYSYFGNSALFKTPHGPLNKKMLGRVADTSVLCK